MRESKHAKIAVIVVQNAKDHKLTTVSHASQDYSSSKQMMASSVIITSAPKGSFMMKPKWVVLNAAMSVQNV